jgi:hypothetical protein
VAAKKLPIEDQVLKLLGDGLGDKEVAEKVGTTPNHVWAFRAASGARPVDLPQPEPDRARRRRTGGISPHLRTRYQQAIGDEPIRSKVPPREPASTS